MPGAFTKTPVERFPVGINFAGQLPTGAAMASATVVATNLTTGSIDNSVLYTTSASISGEVAIAEVMAGALGTTYRLDFTVTLDSGSPAYTLYDFLYVILRGPA